MSFDGRTFLLEYEWLTYMRRMPVRYINRSHSPLCAACGLPGSANMPLQHSHKIPFGRGVRNYKLTPDYLDSPNNTVSAHRGACNKAVELSDTEILLVVQALVNEKAPAEAGAKLPTQGNA